MNEQIEEVQENVGIEGRSAEEDQQMIQQAAAEKAKEDPGLTPEQTQQVKELFKQGYSMVYEKGDFDVMVEHLQAGEDPVPAISLLISGISTALIKEHQLTDIMVIFSAATLLLTDIIDSLNQAGVVELTEEDASTIISKSIENVLNDNPEFASQVMNDPAIQQALSDMQAGKEPTLEGVGVQQPPAQPQLAGVMGGM